MSEFEITSAAALGAAGYVQVQDFGRMQLWSGADQTGEAVSKIFDPVTGMARIIPNGQLDPVKTSLAIGGCVLALISLLSSPTWPDAPTRGAMLATLEQSLG